MMPRCASPLTETPASAAAGTPRRLIWVAGEASRLSGSGETVTRPPTRALRLSAAGAQEAAPGRRRWRRAFACPRRGTG